LFVSLHWPTEAAFLQTLAADPQPASVPVEHFEPVASPVTKHKQVSTQGINPQPISRYPEKAVKTFAHVGSSSRQVHPSGQPQTDHERHTLRLEKTQPLLEEIKSQIEAARSGALPKSVLAKACNYTLTLWTRLTRFLEYPDLELSNNCAENAMRPVALGCKNWIHIGSEEAGPRVAAIVSIVETCRRLNISVRDYLKTLSFRA
jgi:transposase IS66 family protein